jgi:hypothetical protein
MSKPATKRKVQNKLRNYYHCYTVPANSKGAAREEERIQETFHTKGLCLRFNCRIKEWQVWHTSSDGRLYCVMNAGRCLDTAKIIYELRRRQGISSRELWEWYDRQTQIQERQTEQEMDDLAADMAETVFKQATGKVAVSLRDYPQWQSGH